MEYIYTNILTLLLGGLIGYLISNHFYRKSIPFVKHMRSVSFYIEEVYLSTKYPTIFQSNDSIKSSYLSQKPSNTDIPHLKMVCSETDKVQQGKDMFILFRMIDEGLNLSLTSGIEIRNNLNNYSLPISIEGFGWCSCRFTIPEDAPIGKQKLIFNLKDGKGNTNTQEYYYTIFEKEN